MFTSLLCCVFLLAQAQEETPVFRSGVGLKQISVVAQDKKDQPVTNLQRSDFQIFDNGSRQEIRLFLPPEKIAPPDPNVFTNQTRRGYSVILIDSLFTDFGDPNKEPGSAASRYYALKALRSLPAGESIAIYALTRRKFVVICEFTQDRELLVRQLEKWGPDPDTPGTSAAVIDEAAADAEEAEIASRNDVPKIQSRMSGEFGGGAARQDALRRVEANTAELNALAAHLEAMPGRKSLIWLSNRFVLGGNAIRKFNAANVAIYPVDINGAPCNFCSKQSRNGLLMAIAAQTGGVAYFERNDADVAIRSAIADGHSSYTLGFYQPADDSASKFHRISLTTKPGIKLRYRSGYQADGTHGAKPATRADLASAFSSSGDLDGIPIRVSLARVQDRLGLKAVVDAGALDLQLDRTLRTGTIDISAQFIAVDGRFLGDAVSQSISVSLRPERYQDALAHGIAFEQGLTIPPGAVQVRLLVANLSAGRMGSLTLPVK